LEGVLAHELSHVKNYDIRFATIVAIFVGFITILSDIFLRMTFWGGGRSNNREGGGQAGTILVIVGLVLLVVSPIVTKLIQLAISRQREFLADASGAMMTRYPEGLARALEKISQSPPLERAGKATAHLYISSPFKGESWSRWLATHPPIKERVKRLRALT
jgi:heat shock protein HtpX